MIDKAIFALSSNFNNHILLQNLAGSSKLMQDVRRKILNYAKINEPIHITGETGTGKNITAKMLHLLSEKKKAMVYENCANLDSSLRASTLFGHIKGAFTGATTSRKGLFCLGNGTDIFLDEIETLDLTTQAQLLYVLESGNYKAVGSDREQHSDFRLLTASNENLEILSRYGKLRKDLMYRINSLIIELPPLRYHLEDIPEIIDCIEYSRGIISKRFSNFEDLMSQDFPGNVRELYSYIKTYHLL